MNYLKITLSICLVSCLGGPIWAQSGLYSIKQRWEIGISGGGAQYFGELNPNGKIDRVQPGFGAFNRYNASDRIAIRLGAFYSQLEYADNLSSNPYQLARNLSFRTEVLEAQGFLEFNFQKFRKGHRKYWHSPFMIFGAAVCRINPQAFDTANDEWIDLQPLGTEGQFSAGAYQGDNYSQIQPAFVIGGGYKVSLDDYWALSAEFLYHQMFTDYLDDISSRYTRSLTGTQNAEFADRSSTEDFNKIGIPGKTRGDHVDNDSYLTFNLSISFTFKTSECPAPGNKGF